jgi:hypothetical protein
MRGPSSIGSYKSIIQLLQGTLGPYDVEIFNNIKAMLKKITVVIDGKIEKNARVGRMILDPASIRQYTGGSTTKPSTTPDANKPTSKVCQGFPIKYGCKQTEVGRLQQCLGLKVDYSFGPNTLVALVDHSTKKYSKESIALQKQYVEVGVSKAAYDLLLQKCKKSVVKTKQKSQTGKLATAPVVDTRTAAPQRLTSKDIKLMPTTDINKSVADKLQNLPSPGVDNARKLAILGQIIDRGFDQVYKGQILTPEEQSWLNSYMGGGPEKSKLKDGGNAVKQVFNK